MMSRLSIVRQRLHHEHHQHHEFNVAWNSRIKTKLNHLSLIDCTLSGELGLMVFMVLLVQTRHFEFSKFPRIPIGG